MSTACADDSAPQKAAGFDGSTDLPTGKVGVLSVLGSSEVVARLTDTAEEALGQVGWEAVVADGKGDPAVWNQALSSFVQQRVDGVIIIGGIQTGPIAAPLLQAKDAGIPVITAPISSPDPDGFFAAQYAVSGSKFGEVLADYLVQELPPESEWVAIEITADEGANEPNVAALPILEDAGFPRVGTIDVNISGDIPTQVSKGSTDLLRAHPGARMIMSCCDFTAALTVPALEEAGHGDIVNALRFDNLSTLDLIRQGKPVVTAAANADTSILVAIDQLIAHKATDAEIDPEAFDGLDEYVVIDSTNVPEEGFFFDPQEQIDTYLAEWKAEYK